MKLKLTDIAFYMLLLISAFLNYTIFQFQGNDSFLWGGLSLEFKIFLSLFIVLFAGLTTLSIRSERKALFYIGAAVQIILLIYAAMQCRLMLIIDKLGEDEIYSRFPALADKTTYPLKFQILSGVFSTALFLFFLFKLFLKKNGKQGN